MYKFLFFSALIIIEYLATTSKSIKVVESMWDKSNHFIAFFTLYILLSLSYKELSTISKVTLLLLYGLQIELVQKFLPYRDFSFLDILADSVGILIGVIFYKKIENKNRLLS